LEVAHFERQRIHVRGGVRLPCGVLWNVSGKSSNGSVQLGKQSNKNIGLLLCLTTGGYQ
jgi:hypothetical protein